MEFCRTAVLVLGLFAADAIACDSRPGDARSDPTNPIASLFQGQRLDLWSLQPLRVATPPESADASAPPGEIDRFVQARLQAAGIPPAAPADHQALVRRLHLDLTGLPPEPGVVEAVAADSSPDAIARLIDRLLASPRFGEHWARLWLDVVRYSDSNGFDWDEFRPEAWRFRDYVIRSYNADKPFDRFLTEQLAGDELVDGPPRDEAERDALIATGYLRIGPQDNSASLFNEQDRARHEVLSDLTETTGSAFLALTLACCRCHDHKTEPLAQADHYRFRAFFETVTPGDELALDLAAEQEVILAGQAKVDEITRPLTERRAQLLVGGRQRLVAGGIKDPTDESARKAFTAEEQSEDEALGRQIRDADAGRPALTRGLLMTDAVKARELPPESRVLSGGDHLQPREVVPAGFPMVLDPAAARLVAPPNPRTSGRRLTLARWLASPDNPLTARVYVNRLWQALFGRGLVATPNDFGYSGERPSHPELLDWLAARFMAEGWSTKRLVRTIVLSATYRQSAVNQSPAARAAEPAWLAAQSRRRLSAEQLRDAQLAVAGLLLPAAGGPPIWPELPREILTANPAFLDDNETKTKGWYPSPPDSRHVRSVFLVQKRTVRVPFMESFDLPENATSCGRRAVSTVAPQALVLLNGSLTSEVAPALASRIRQLAGADPVAQIDHGFQIAVQRLPTAYERERSLAFLESRSLEEFARVLVNLNEFIYVD